MFSGQHCWIMGECTEDLELMPGNSSHIDDLLNLFTKEIVGPMGENDHTNYWSNDEG
jgi:hypothetical protein